MSDWVSTKRVAGEVVFKVGTTLAGELHLQLRTAVRPGEETPLEMLNRPDGFFPLTLANGEVRLVSKDQVAAVALQGEAADGPPSPATRPLYFDVYMADGSKYEGEVRIELRPPSTRGLDLLNQDERFFALSAPHKTLYLNRSHVQHVRPHD